ncbi:MAG: hypothetical protein ABIJ31_03200 [Pseudomonadota bacterium]
MSGIRKISAVDAKARVDADLSLLVCIYDDAKFHSRAHLEGAIPMSEFLKMVPDLSLGSDIIFY